MGKTSILDAWAQAEIGKSAHSAPPAQHDPPSHWKSNQQPPEWLYTPYREPTPARTQHSKINHEQTSKSPKLASSKPPDWSCTDLQRTTPQFTATDYSSLRVYPNQWKFIINLTTAECSFAKLNASPQGDIHTNFGFNSNIYLWFFSSTYTF